MFFIAYTSCSHDWFIHQLLQFKKKKIIFNILNFNYIIDFYSKTSKIQLNIIIAIYWSLHTGIKLFKKYKFWDIFIVNTIKFIFYSFDILNDKNIYKI